jgi:hypothetical protein
MANIIKHFKKYFHLFEYMTDEQFNEFDYIPDLEIDKNIELITETITLTLTPDNIYNVLKLADVYQFKKLNELLEKTCNGKDVNIYDLDLHTFCFILNLLNIHSPGLLSVIINKIRLDCLCGTLKYKNYGTLDDMIFGTNTKTCLYNRSICPNRDACSACYSYKEKKHSMLTHDARYVIQAFNDNDLELVKCLKQYNYCLDIFKSGIKKNKNISFEFYSYLIDNMRPDIKDSYNNIQVSKKIIKYLDVEHLKYFVVKFNIKLHFACLFFAINYNKLDHVKFILSHFKTNYYSLSNNNSTRYIVHHILNNTDCYDTNKNKFHTMTEHHKKVHYCSNSVPKQNCIICGSKSITKLQYIYFMVAVIIKKKLTQMSNYLLENIDSFTKNPDHATFIKDTLTAGHYLLK